MSLRDVILASLGRVDGCCLDDAADRERVADALECDLRDAISFAITTAAREVASTIEGALNDE